MGSSLLILGLILASLIILFLTLFAFCSLQRKRLMIDTPTSKTLGVFIGFVELKGTAEAKQGESLTSFLANLPSVYYHSTIEEHWSRTHTETVFVNGKPKIKTRTESGWKTVVDKRQETLFYLKDETGSIRINPDKAEIDSIVVFNKECSLNDPLYYEKGPANSISDSTNQRRFVERAIPLHQPIYILGQSRVREDIVAAEIVYDPNVSTFIISTQSESKIQTQENCKTILFIVLASLLLVGGLAYFSGNFYSGILGGAIYWSCCGIVWSVIIYNSLIRLNNRVEQAWANVDVELKRRAELIPNLVRIVEAMKTHEEETNLMISKLRTQVKSYSSNAANCSSQAVAQVVVGIVEKYPELKSNELFINLQQNLIHSEERIALARNFYNDSVEAFHNRREMFPDCCVAPFLGLPSHQYVMADQFEIKPVSVSFE